jgi:hypothetical protein
LSAPVIPQRPATAAVPLDPDTLVDVNEFEDTQPSVVLPDDDDDFSDAPTIPGFRLRAYGLIERDRHASERDVLHDGQWDRVLRAVAAAVKRVFASHSLD